MSRSLLIEILDKSRAETEVALANLDMNKVIYEQSDWRIKDIIGHIAIWEQMALFALMAYQEGRQFVVEEDRDTINAEQVERRRNFTSERIRREWMEIRERLRTLLLEFPEDLMEGNCTFPSGEAGPVSQLVQEIVSHEIKHRRDILRALGRQEE